MPSSPLKKDYVNDLHFKVPISSKKYNLISTNYKKQYEKKICRYSNVIQMKCQNDLIYGITSDGAFIIYEKKFNAKKQLDGKALFVYPQNIIVSCQFKNGNLHKQCIIFCKNVFLLVLNFDNGVLEKQQINFSYGAQLLTKSLYKKNILQNITKSTITSQNQNQLNMSSIFKDKILIQKIEEVVSYKILWAKPIIMQNTIYYGQINNEQLPEGIGLAFTEKNKETQIYFGNFQSGLLNGIGCISFFRWKNYFGQFENGQFVGIGKYFQNNKNIYMDQKQKISYKIYKQLLLQYCFDKNMSKKNQKQLKVIQTQYSKLIQIYSKYFEFIEQKTYSNELTYDKKIKSSKTLVPSLNLFNSQQINQKDQENKSNEQELLINQFTTKRKKNKTQLQDSESPSKKTKNDDGKKKSIFKNVQNQNRNQRLFTNGHSFQKNSQVQNKRKQKHDFNEQNQLIGSRNLLQKTNLNRLRKASTEIIQVDQKQLSWQQLSNDSNYVEKQYSFMIPNKLQTYPTFNKTQQLMKNIQERYIHPEYMKQISEKEENQIESKIFNMYNG